MPFHFSIRALKASFERFGWNFEEGFVVVGHDPEPLQIAVPWEGCLVNMSLPGTPDFVPESIIVELNRLGDAIDGRSGLPQG